MPFYTRVFSQQSPNSVYELEHGNIVLIPYGTCRLDDGYGGDALFDVTNVFTNATSKEQHREQLRRFCIIFSFLFRDVPIDMFDAGELGVHVEVNSIDDVPVDYSDGRDKFDFDDILPRVYFLNSLNLAKSFRRLKLYR